MQTLILVVFLFAVMIFPHELGHFIAARLMGVGVNEFSFGMGPAIFKKQKGNTLYSIRIFPIGGFCAMEGEDDESERDDAFNNKPASARIFILAAGSFMNVLIAVLVMSILMTVNGQPTTSIREVNAGSPAEQAGLLAGDEILSISGEEILEWSDVSRVIGEHPEEVTVTVSRDGEEIELRMQPEILEDRYVIGILPAFAHDPLKGIVSGVKSTGRMFVDLYDSLRLLITGEVPVSELQGPVGMAVLVSETKTYGFYYFFYLLSFISINLAVMNMLPLPALDGGRILFVLIRKITGKAVTDRMEGTVHLIGMGLLLALMVMVTWHDIVRLIS